MRANPVGGGRVQESTSGGFGGVGGRHHLQGGTETFFTHVSCDVTKSACTKEAKRLVSGPRTKHETHRGLRGVVQCSGTRRNKDR